MMIIFCVCIYIRIIYLYILAYHSKCIDPWLTKNRRVCPVCKRKVFAADEQVITDESDSDADDSTPLIRDGYQGKRLVICSALYVIFLQIIMKIIV